MIARILIITLLASVGARAFFLTTTCFSNEICDHMNTPEMIASGHVYQCIGHLCLVGPIFSTQSPQKRIIEPCKVDADCNPDHCRKPGDEFCYIYDPEHNLGLCDCRH